MQASVTDPNGVWDPCGSVVDWGSHVRLLDLQVLKLCLKFQNDRTAKLKHSLEILNLEATRGLGT